MNNNLKTVLLLSGLGALIIAIGSLFGTSGIYIGFFLALALSGGSYWFSAKIAIKASGSRPLEAGELPWLRQMVEDLAREAKIPMPELYISPEMQPNAFATGRNPQHAAVAVTQGILQVLEPEELRAVLAHEISHVTNRDILLTSVAAVFGSTVSMVAQFLPFTMMSNDEDNAPNPIFAVALSIVGPILAMFMQLALSRSREFQADASGAALLHNGEPLAQALLKIEAYAQQIPMNVNASQAQAYIINPLSGFNVSGLFRTHPSTEERVARLRAYAQRG